MFPFSERFQSVLETRPGAGVWSYSLSERGQERGGWEERVTSLALGLSANRGWSGAGR